MSTDCALVVLQRRQRADQIAAGVENRQSGTNGNQVSSGCRSHHAAPRHPATRSLPLEQNPVRCPANKFTSFCRFRRRFHRLGVARDGSQCVLRRSQASICVAASEIMSPDGRVRGRPRQSGPDLRNHSAASSCVQISHRSGSASHVDGIQFYCQHAGGGRTKFAEILPSFSSTNAVEQCFPVGGREQPGMFRSLHPLRRNEETGRNSRCAAVEPGVHGVRRLESINRLSPNW